MHKLPKTLIGNHENVEKTSTSMWKILSKWLLHLKIACQSLMLCRKHGSIEFSFFPGFFFNPNRYSYECKIATTTLQSSHSQPTTSAFQRMYRSTWSWCGFGRRTWTNALVWATPSTAAWTRPAWDCSGWIPARGSSTPQTGWTTRPERSTSSPLWWEWTLRKLSACVLACVRACARMSGHIISLPGYPPAGSSYSLTYFELIPFIYHFLQCNSWPSLISLIGQGSGVSI